MTCVGTHSVSHVLLKYSMFLWTLNNNAQHLKIFLRLIHRKFFFLVKYVMGINSSEILLRKAHGRGEAESRRVVTSRCRNDNRHFLVKKNTIFSTIYKYLPTYKTWNENEIYGCIVHSPKIILEQWILRIIGQYT